MNDLARTLGETIHAGMLDGISLVHVARAVPEAGPHMALRLGAREAAHMTALGKAIMAAMPPDEALQRYPHEELPVRTRRTIATRTGLAAELRRTRRRGYGLDDQESREGVKCVGVPIFDPGGRPTLALSVTTTPVHLSGARLQLVVREVRRAASLVTAAFGGVVPSPWSDNGTDV
jgi:DNA-binding IclR family transcriptional regulator